MNYTFAENHLHVFLDLEQTLIKSWDECTIMNPAMIDMIARAKNSEHSLFGSRTPIQFHIFSYAIFDANDLAKFQSCMKEHIEKYYRFSITNVVLKEDVLKAVMDQRKLSILDEFELTQLYGKRDGFIDFAKAHKIENTVLLDDMVENVTYRINYEDANYMHIFSNVKFEI
jgi:hypothetical protein